MSFKVNLRAMLLVLLRAMFFLFLFLVGVVLSAMLSSWYVTRQLSKAMEPPTPAAEQQSEPQRSLRAEEPTEEIDFFTATGIDREELQKFLQNEPPPADHLALITVQNSRGDYLTESPMMVRWDAGEQALRVGKSGVLRFPLKESMLAGLKIFAPAGYTELRQRSIPLGSAYDPVASLETSELPFHVHDDLRFLNAIPRELAQLQTTGQFVPYEQFQEQLRLRVAQVELAPPREEALTVEEVYRLNRDSVVIISHLFPDGHMAQASGVVLDSSGVVATSYHAVDNPTAIARGVLTSDCRMHSIKRVLAADKPGDVVLLQIEAEGLHAAPLGPAAQEGAAVTLISHPDSCFYSLTRGHVTRYWATTNYGRKSLRMGVTAEFADGSSGGPLFDACGNVVGIVAGTENRSYQMVHRTAIPSHTLRTLIHTADDGS
jgi:serine protease Do